jgi:Family of unknown function (DUF6228)
MSEARIGAGSEYLLLARTPEHEVPELLTAHLRLDGVDATVAVASHYASRFRDLAEFFEGLATAWRGWDGPRRWESLEGDLNLEARHEFGTSV